MVSSMPATSSEPEGVIATAFHFALAGKGDGFVCGVQLTPESVERYSLPVLASLTAAKILVPSPDWIFFFFNFEREREMKK